MVLILHILVAILGIISATYLLIQPSKRVLNASVGLVATTLITGTYLTLTGDSHLLQACISGVSYLAITSIMIAFGKNKLTAKTKA